jgi:hypothetical protein
VDGWSAAVFQLLRQSGEDDLAALQDDALRGEGQGDVEMLLDEEQGPCSQ